MTTPNHTPDDTRPSTVTFRLDSRQAGQLPRAFFRTTADRGPTTNTIAHKDGSVTVTVSLGNGDDHLVSWLMDVISRTSLDPAPDQTAPGHDVSTG